MSIGNVGDVGSADNVENWGIIGNSGKFGMTPVNLMINSPLEMF